MELSASGVEPPRIDLSVPLSVCLSVCTSVCPSVCLSVCLSVATSLSVSRLICIFLYISASAYLSLGLLLYLSVHFSLSICLVFVIYGQAVPVLGPVARPAASHTRSRSCWASWRPSHLPRAAPRGCSAASDRGLPSSHRRRWRRGKAPLVRTTAVDSRQYVNLMFSICTLYSCYCVVSVLRFLLNICCVLVAFDVFLFSRLFYWCTGYSGGRGTCRRCVQQ